MMLIARLIPALLLGFVFGQPTAAAAVPASPSSPPSHLVGSWHGVAIPKLKAPVSIDLVLLPDGRFGERSKYKGMKRMRFGRYEVKGGNVLRFKIAHWEPVRACTRKGCEPPSIDYEVKFVSATRLVLQEKGRASINFKRIRQVPMTNPVAK